MPVSSSLPVRLLLIATAAGCGGSGKSANSEPTTPTVQLTEPDPAVSSSNPDLPKEPAAGKKTDEKVLFQPAGECEGAPLLTRAVMKKNPSLVGDFTVCRKREKGQVCEEPEPYKLQPAIVAQAGVHAGRAHPAKVKGVCEHAKQCCFVASEIAMVVDGRPLVVEGKIRFASVARRAWA